jgi:hypothetical protein
VGDPIQGELLATESTSRHPLQVASLDEPLRLGRISMQVPVSTGRLCKATEKIILSFSQILFVVAHLRSLGAMDRRSSLKGSYSKVAIKTQGLDL